MFKHLTFLLFIACRGFVSQSTSNDVVDCTNEDIVTSIFNEPIDLSLNGTIRVYENVTINQISSTTNNEFDRNYIDARLESVPETAGISNLIVYTTEHFAHYAAQQSSGRITLKIMLGCDMGRERTLIFFQPLKEGNYFSPEFAKAVYEIIMPTPIFTGFDLTLFAEISAKDDDLTNNQIVFSSDDADAYHMTVGTKNSTSTDKKTYYAELTLDRIYLALSSEITFEIIAADNGIPPKSSVATVVVRADPRNSLPATPQFERTIYNASLSTDLILQPFQVVLVAETYTSEVNFTASGEDQHFFALKNNANVVEVDLARAINKDNVKGKKYLQFEIKAENKNLADYGKTAVIVELPNVKEHFRFVKTLYEGFIDDIGDLKLADIVFDPYTYRNEVSFELNGSQQEFFVLNRTENILKLQLSDEFSPDHHWGNATFFTFEILATLDDVADSTAAIVIRLPKVNLDSDKRPEFERPLYVGSINKKYELNMEAMVLLPDLYEANETEFLLTGNAHNFFEFVSKDNTVKLLLKPGLIVDELPQNSTILLVLTARNNNFKTSAAIAIETETTLSTSITKIFDRAWSIGNIALDKHDAQVLSLEALAVNYKYKVNELTFTLEGDEADLFDVVVDAFDNNVYIRIIKLLPEPIIANGNNIYLNLSAIHDVYAVIRDTTLVVIELPRRTCTVATPPTFQPQFDSSEYIFAAKPTQVGIIGQINAIIQGSNAAVRYSINVKNEHLQKLMAINTNSGELMLLSYVSPGIYFFSINAENSETFGNKTVNARLEVDSIVQCDDKHVTVANALLVKYIDEEEEHMNILNTIIEDCHLEIVHMFPNDKAYVYINASTKMLSTIAIDREDKIFAEMFEPQVQVKLKLVCDGDNYNQTLARQKRDVVDNYALVMATDIPTAKDVTMVNLIIVDINDTPPVFVYPAVGFSTYLGYPESKICLQLFPQELAHVAATDLDSGLNARIRYSMRSNEHFNIDALSGVIYPKVNALRDDDSTQLFVQATDRDGAAGGLSTGTVLVVKRLSAEYFSMLTLRTSDRQSIEGILEVLNNKTGYTVNAIKYATITENSTESRSGSLTGYKLHSRQTADNVYVQKAWIYAFDNNAPVKCKDFEDKILAIGLEDQPITFESFEEISSISTAGQYMGVKTAVYVATIAVLFIISVACISFLMWRFYFFDCCTSVRKLSNGSIQLQCETISETDSQKHPVVNRGCNKDGSTLDATQTNPNRKCKIVDNLHHSFQAPDDKTDNHTLDSNSRILYCSEPTERSQIQSNEIADRVYTRNVDDDGKGCV